MDSGLHPQFCRPVARATQEEQLEDGGRAGGGSQGSRAGRREPADPCRKEAALMRKEIQGTPDCQE